MKINLEEILSLLICPQHGYSKGFGNEIKWEGNPAPSAGMYFVEIRQPGKSPVRKKWLVNGR